MQIKRRALAVKPKVAQKKPLTGRALERQIIARKFLELKQKGISKEEINRLIKLRQNAIKLSNQGINLARKGKPNVQIQGKASNAWQEFYKELSRY